MAVAGTELGPSSSVVRAGLRCLLCGGGAGIFARPPYGRSRGGGRGVGGGVHHGAFALVLFPTGRLPSRRWRFVAWAVAVCGATGIVLYPFVRRRIQSFIDRRFYRRKYDAQKTLSAFSKKLRDETDLDVLGDDLVAVVRNTVHPVHISLWLKPTSTDEQAREDRGVARA